MTSSHQAHAAHCRHAAANTARLRYWRFLDEQYRVRLVALPELLLCRFTSIERRQILDTAYLVGFQPSTLKTWLREWRKYHEDADAGGIK